MRSPRRLAGTHEIAQRLELERRDADRPQLPGGMQPGELERITAIGLDPITGLARIAPGEQTITSTPAALAARANPNPVGPVS
jgi:hypothetical protein